jgi:hypothetical protein
VLNGKNVGKKGCQRREEEFELIGWGRKILYIL